MLSGYPKLRDTSGMLSGYSKARGSAGMLSGLPNERRRLDRSHPVNKDLIRYFPMSEGSGPTLTDLCVQNSAPFPASGFAWSGGVKGSASILSDGSSQIAVANPTATDLPSGASAKSMSIWLRPASVSAGYHWGAAYGLAGASQTMMIGRNGTTLYGAFYANDLSIASFWAAGTWANIVLTYDGTTSYLYANGALVAQGPKTLNLVKSLFYVGNMVSGAERWDGDITQLRLYGRCIAQYDVTQIFIDPWVGTF